ncbi:MAG: exodeoxyribonuclease III [Anaerolineae bacterium]|nr:exodeoxyribonuclease III [Anaerolineae bacterium]
MDNNLSHGTNNKPFAKKIKLISWNVNGIRAITNKGFFSWLNENKPDILCLQETKASKAQLTNDLLQPSGYFTYWNDAIKKGYSGTSLFSRQEPLEIEFGLGIAEFDSEGRTIVAYYPDFVLINCYFPNGRQDLSRVKFKLEFYEAFLAKCEQLRKNGHIVIFCGDVNTAHKEIDLSHPKSNEKETGFLPEERAWLDKISTLGYVDTFRFFFPTLTEKFTWWSNFTKSREKNIGWRLDYFFIVKEYVERVAEAFILSDVMGSDHCPIGIKLFTNAWQEGTFQEKTFEHKDNDIKVSQMSLF